MKIRYLKIHTSIFAICMAKHIVDTRQLKDRRFLEGLFSRADDLRANVNAYSKTHEGKIVLSLFFQPSTRTKMTFDAAAKKLGAQVIGTENAREFSSVYKGETLEHSLLAIHDCFDLVVMRHHENGAAKRAAAVLDKPLINAGDGTNQHPTQALLDLYTLRQAFGRIEGLKIAFLGDAAQGRTIRSLAYLLANLKDNKLVFICPEELGLGEDMKSYLKEKKAGYEEMEDFEDAIADIDALYVTRLQWEYAKDEELKNRLMEIYKRFQVTSSIADRMKENSIIMHPLPINTEKSEGFPEITQDVDKNPRAWYFRQSNNGLYVRMSLLDILLSGEEDELYNLILDVP